jgi:hypothetical protein
MAQTRIEIEQAKKIAPAIHAFTNAIADAGLGTFVLFVDWVKCNTLYAEGNMALKRTSVWLDEKNYRVLEALGKKMGGLKPAQLIRIAVQEYVDRKAKEKK